MRFTILHLGRIDDAIAAYRAALRCLPSDEIRHRFSACQGLATAHHRQGDFRQAEEYVCRAEPLASAAGRDSVAALTVMKAKIAIGLGHYLRAERYFTTAATIYKTLSPIDAALVGLDLLRVQFVHGRTGSALETIRSMSELLGPLKDNKIASEAISQLVRLALTGKRVTHRMLDHVTQEIKKERARLVRRARGKI